MIEAFRNFPCLTSKPHELCPRMQKKKNEPLSRGSLTCSPLTKRGRRIDFDTSRFFLPFFFFFFFCSFHSNQQKYIRRYSTDVSTNFFSAKQVKRNDQVLAEKGINFKSVAAFVQWNVPATRQTCSPSIDRVSFGDSTWSGPIFLLSQSRFLNSHFSL